MGHWAELMTARSSHSSIIERYTESLQRAVTYAKQEAIQQGEAAVTVADLLAGLMEEDDSRAVRTGSLKANANYLRWLAELPALPRRCACSVVTGQSIELDDETRRAMAYAVMEADHDREYWIDSDHLLRGLLRFPNRGNFAVLKTELDLHKLRAASRADRQQFPSHEAPDFKLLEYMVRKYVRLLGPLFISLVCYLYILIQGLGVSVLRQAR